MKPKIIKEKRLSDLYLVSYLLTTGFKILRTSNEDKATLFHFEDTEELNQFILSFFNKTARVDPMSFAQYFKGIKTLIKRGGVQVGFNHEEGNK